jgi:hypothetical protein
MMSHMVGKLRLGLEVRREHWSVHPIALWRSTVFIVVLLIIGATIEIRWAFVLIWTAVVGVPRDQVAHVA